MRHYILMLEDDSGRIEAFRKTVPLLGGNLELKVWRDAPAMMAECVSYFPESVLIALDHDLNPMDESSGDPGTGLDLAQFLGDFLPACPVLIHSSNTDRVWSMHNELRFAGWNVDRVGPLGSDWIETSWLRAAQRLIASFPSTWAARLPGDHAKRVERMRLSLLGLGLGDALGEMLSGSAQKAVQSLATGDLPSGPWFHTDDTEMAISVSAILNAHGHIEQDGLAKRFFDSILRHTPDSQVRRKLLIAAETDKKVPPEFAAQQLGNGSLVTAQDTVPFCIWMAAHHADSFVGALGNTIRVGGDCDTNAAIVGGIVALSAGREHIPLDWINAREPLNF